MEFRCQQSPSFGTPLTGATSAHHLVTPTSERLAPIAQRIDVALGASETMRSGEACDRGIVLSLAETGRSTGLGVDTHSASEGLQMQEKRRLSAAARHNYFLS